MDTVLGFVGFNYVMIMADTGVQRSIVRMKSDEDKILQLDGKKIMGIAGEQGDRAQFGEFIQKNVALYELNNGYPLSVSGAANFTRNELATALRKGPYNVNLLLGGVDKDGSASLFYMDYLASLNKMNYAVHGYSAYFLFSLLDRYYVKNMTIEQGLELAHKCQDELRKRFMVHLPDFIIKIVDANGVRILEGPGASSSSNKPGPGSPVSSERSAPPVSVVPSAMAVESTSARNPAVEKAIASLPQSLWARIGLTADASYEAVERFMRYDKDKSGTLNKGELVELLVELFRDRMTRANIERVANLQTAAFDKDRSGTLNLEEFVALFASVQKQAPAKK